MISKMDLSGKWHLRHCDGVRGKTEYATRWHTDARRYIEAEVPGAVHLDLMRAGLLDDPAYGMNCLKARWVEEGFWCYRRFFKVPSAARNKGCRAWLVFESLDLTAAVYLNGTKIGSHANVYHPCRIEVTGLLSEGRNLLAVILDSGPQGVADKPIGPLKAASSDSLNKSVWLRKPQFQFGWDWSTRLVNVGITGPVRLEYTTEPVRSRQVVPLSGLSPDLKTGRLDVRWQVEGLTDRDVKCEYRIEILDTGQSVVVPVTIGPGDQCLTAALEVPSPRLWWPRGYGRQHLYTVRVLLRRGAKILAEETARVGFRQIVIDQTPHPEEGNYFTVKVNGTPVFCKGANFVPSDMILARHSSPRVKRLLDLAEESHFNFLRIWGGGGYESSDFYEACDERGILVWQDFAFACRKFPGFDPEFAQSVTEEATWQVRRLARHPSLIVWCGNNEMDWANAEWKGFQEGWLYPDHALFHYTLPDLLRKEDPSRFYWPSSPSSPDGSSPNADHAGDQHPWSVGFSNPDFRDYRKMVCRFPNEGGFLGPPSLPTLMDCLPEGHREVQSLAWQLHDNAVDTWAEPGLADAITEFWLGRDCREMTPEAYTYWGGLLQGEALSEYIGNFRRRMPDSSAAVFWMFNDCWPTTRSWTTVDYQLRRTPSFHPVRRAFAPIAVQVVEEGEEVVIWGVNDRARTVKGTLRYGIFKFDGAFPVDLKQEVVLPPQQSTRIASFPRSSWRRIRESAAFALLETNGGLLARHRLILPRFRELRWLEPKWRVDLEDGHAVFRSPVFVWGVCLDLQGEMKYPDNFFDLYPGVPYVLPWKHSEPPRVLGTGNLSD